MSWAVDVPSAEGWLLVSTAKTVGSPSNRHGLLDRYVVLLPDGLIKCFAGKPPNRSNPLPGHPGPGVEGVMAHSPRATNARTSLTMFDIPMLPLSALQDKHRSPHMSPRMVHASERVHINPSPSPFGSPRMPLSARQPVRGQEAAEDPSQRNSARGYASPLSARMGPPVQVPKLKPPALDGFPPPARASGTVTPQIRESPRTGQSSVPSVFSPQASFLKQNSQTVFSIMSSETEPTSSQVLLAAGPPAVPRIASESSADSLPCTKSCPPPHFDGRSAFDYMPRAESEMIDRSALYPESHQATHRRTPSLDAREPAAEAFFFPPGSEITPLNGNRILVQHRPTQAHLTLTAHSSNDHVQWLRALRKVIPKTPTGNVSPNRSPPEGGPTRSPGPPTGIANGTRTPEAPRVPVVPRLAALPNGDTNGGFRTPSARDTAYRSPRLPPTAAEQQASPRGGGAAVALVASPGPCSPRPPRVGLTDFRLQSCVGAGKFGKVFKVQALFDQQVYAMKAIKKCDLRHGVDPDHPTYQDVLRELRIMQRLRHPFIVPLLASFQTPERLFIVMPFLSGGEVFTVMKRLCWKEETLRVHGAQIVLALDHMHQLGIVYRDMKPENVILDRDGNCLLADFGLAVEANTKGRACSLGGTDAYMAPEVYGGKSTDRIRTAGDWWGVGCVLFEMATGMHPFILPCGRIDVEAAQAEDPNLLGLSEGSDLSEEFLDLVFAFLEKTPEKRLCGKENVAQHPFFGGLDWEGVLAKRVKPQFDGESWGSVLDSLVKEDDRFDPACSSRTAELEPAPAGDPLVGFDFVSEELRPRLK